MAHYDVLIIGAGDMGARHAAGYRALENARIRGIADPDQDRAAQLAAQCPGATAYASYHDALAQAHFDIVSVCVPAALHAEAAIAALEHGCHVLCEKPIALTLEQAQRMADATDRAPGMLGIVFQRRYMAVWREVTKRLPALGTPLYYQATDFRPVRPKILMHSKSGNGGPVIDCCVHDFDMTMRLFGAPRAVYAVGDTFAQGKPQVHAIQDLALDTAVINLTFAAGHKALIAYSWGLPEGFPGSIRVEIIGPNGIIKVDDTRLEHHLPGGIIETVSGLSADGHTTQIAEFVAAIAAGKQPPVPPAEAIAALKVAHATLDAIESGAPHRITI